MQNGILQFLECERVYRITSKIFSQVIRSKTDEFRRDGPAVSKGQNCLEIYCKMEYHNITSENLPS